MHGTCYENQAWESALPVAESTGLSLSDFATHAHTHAGEPGSGAHWQTRRTRTKGRSILRASRQRLSHRGQDTTRAALWKQIEGFRSAEASGEVGLRDTLRQQKVTGNDFFFTGAEGEEFSSGHQMLF